MSELRTVVPWLALLALAAPCPGQRASRATLVRELDTHRQALLKSQIKADRTLDELINLRLGLLLDSGAHFALSEAERARPREEVEQELTELTQDIARLNRKLRGGDQALEEHKAGLRASTAGRDQNRPPDWQPEPGGARVARQPEPVPIPVDPPAPAVEVRTPAVVPRAPDSRPMPAASDRPDRPVSLVQPTRDRGLRGRALFHAGRYEAARQELEPIAKTADAQLTDLFYLARALERLGNLAGARDLFLQVETRDRHRDQKGVDRPGAWAQSARAARQHMDWLRDHGSWRPPELGGGGGR